MERVVLFRVKHFQHSRAGISAVVATQFVYLVQDNHRIGRFGFYQTFDDAAGHGTDISFAVSSNFGFIMYAT